MRLVTSNQSKSIIALCFVIIQSENKKFKIASDNLTGPLLLVNHIVKQDYFPPHTAKTLHFYLTQ